MSASLSVTMLRRPTAVLLRTLSSLDKAVPIENRCVAKQQDNVDKKQDNVVKHRTDLSDIEVVRSPVHMDIEDILNKKKHIIVDDSKQTGLFGVDSLGTDKSFQTYVDNVIADCNNLLKQISTRKDIGNIQIIDEVIEQVTILSNITLFIAQSASDQRIGANVALQQAEKYISDLNKNEDIFRVLKRAVKTIDVWEKLDRETQRTVAMWMLDYTNIGIELSTKEQVEIENINKQIRSSGVVFVKKSVQPVKIPIESCPEPLLGLPFQDNKIILSDWCNHEPSDAVREHAWRNYHKYDVKREQALHAVLDHRHQLAQATGYKNYAERALQGSMAGCPVIVREFLEELHTQIRPLARWEYFQFERSKLMDSKYWHNHGYFKLQEVVVFPWDPQYYSSEMKRFYIKSETPVIYPNLPDFLSVGSVIEQIGVWFEDTFAVTLVAEIPQKGELWSKDVIKLAVEHENDGLLGFLYLDFYNKDVRRAAPCHHVIRSGTNKTLPISVIECDYIPGDGYRPPHLTMNSLEKLFTELGSAVHTMLSRTQYYQTSAGSMSPDTSRISSYLLQNIARHPALLYHVLKHHTRTRVLPRVDPDKVVAMSNAMNIFNSHQVEYQLLYSSLDQTLHTEWPDSDGRTSTDLFAKHIEKYTHMPYIDDTAPHLRFTGLFTQGAQYYSHLWSQAIANILYEELFSVDPFSRHAGEYFREHFLRHGAARNPREMVEYLTGTKLTPDRLATALVKPHELAQNYSAGYHKTWGKVSWNKEASPDSPLLARLADTHPHLLGEGGQLIPPPPFRGQVRSEAVPKLES